MDTPGPLSICLTNMVIVFAVLIFLAFVIQLILSSFSSST